MTMDPEIEKTIQADGGLYSLGWYLSWDVGEEKACLDGEFTPNQLRSIADHMDKMNGAHT